VGATELELSPAHRLSGAIEPALGMLMFGWTALLLDLFPAGRPRGRGLWPRESRPIFTMNLLGIEHKKGQALAA